MNVVKYYWRNGEGPVAINVFKEYDNHFQEEVYKEPERAGIVWFPEELFETAVDATNDRKKWLEEQMVKMTKDLSLVYEQLGVQNLG